MPGRIEPLTQGLAPPADRPAGVTTISLLLGTLSAAALVFVALLLFALVPLSYGSILLPNGLEQSGPVGFVIYSAICGVIGFGLWRGFNWVRRVAILFAIAGIAFVVPAISSAVVDGRVGRIAVEGLQIIVRVAVVYYLSQEPVKDWFTTPQTN